MCRATVEGHEMLGKHVPVTNFSVLVGVRLVSVGVRFHVGVPFGVAWFQGQVGR